MLQLSIYCSSSSSMLRTQPTQDSLGMFLWSAALLVLLQANCMGASRIKQAPRGVLDRARKAKLWVFLLFEKPLRPPLLTNSPPQDTQQHSHHHLLQQQRQMAPEMRQVAKTTRQQV
jgi:hypothetical protein